jgi:Spy/CpxP family protein refolding chaperone
MKRFLIHAALLAAFLAPVPAAAQMLEMPGGKWWKRPAVVETLKLSPEQQQRLDEVFQKNRRAFVDLKADVDRRTIDLEDLLEAHDVDPRKVGAASEALEQARGRLGKARTMMVVEMRGILTEAQWKQISDRRDQWRVEREGEMRKRFNRQRGNARPGGARPEQAPMPEAAPDLPEEP